MTVATLELAAKLAILEEARQRLETELERDEHWRALRQPLQGADAERLGAERQARDRRLRMALEANPVYTAWLNVADAAATLRSRGLTDAGTATSVAQAPNGPEPAASSHGESPTAPEPTARASSLSNALQRAQSAQSAPEPHEEEATDPSENLPPEIAALIRAEVTAGEEQPHLVESDRELHEVGERAARAVDKLLSIPSVEPVAPMHLETARRPDRLESELREINERRQARTARSSQRDIVTEAAPVPRPAANANASPPTTSDDLDFLLSPAGAPWVAFDASTEAEETQVTVVSRHVPEPPNDAGEPQRQTFLERLRAEETPATAAPSSGERTRRLHVSELHVSEEAEVTVVRPSQATITTVAQTPAPTTAAPAPRPLRRLIKALIGQ